MDRSEIDPRYLIRPYYLRPDGKVGHDAFAVIRETIREMDKVAIGRVVLTNREHIIALEPLDKGLMGTLLRYPYEVREPAEYFDEIQDVRRWRIGKKSGTERTLARMRWRIVSTADNDELTARLDYDKGVSGRLIELGRAPYRNRDNAETSAYVAIELDSGRQHGWGVGRKRQLPTARRAPATESKCRRGASSASSKISTSPM